MSSLRLHHQRRRETPERPENALTRKFLSIPRAYSTDLPAFIYSPLERMYRAALSAAFSAGRQHNHLRFFSFSLGKFFVFYCVSELRGFGEKLRALFFGFHPGTNKRRICCSTASVSTKGIHPIRSYS